MELGKVIHGNISALMAEHVGTPLTHHVRPRLPPCPQRLLGFSTAFDAAQRALSSAVSADATALAGAKPGQTVGVGPAPARPDHANHSQRRPQPLSESVWGKMCEAVGRRARVCAYAAVHGASVEVVAGAGGGGTKRTAGRPPKQPAAKRPTNARQPSAASATAGTAPAAAPAPDAPKGTGTQAAEAKKQSNGVASAAVNPTSTITGKAGAVTGAAGSPGGAAAGGVASPAPTPSTAGGVKRARPSGGTADEAVAKLARSTPTDTPTRQGPSPPGATKSGAKQKSVSEIGVWDKPC